MPKPGDPVTGVSVPRSWIRRPCSSDVSFRVRRRTVARAGLAVGHTRVLGDDERVSRPKRPRQADGRVRGPDPRLDSNLEQGPRIRPEARPRRGGLRVAGVEVVDLVAVRVRSRGVAHEDQPGARRDVPEVDDEVGPFGRRQQELRRAGPADRRQGRTVEVDRRRQEAAFGSDLDEGGAGEAAGLPVVLPLRIDETRVQEAGLAGIQHAEPVLALLDLEERVGGPVDKDRVSEELRHDRWVGRWPGGLLGGKIPAIRVVDVGVPQVARAGVRHDRWPGGVALRDLRGDEDLVLERQVDRPRVQGAGQVMGGNELELVVVVDHVRGGDAGIGIQPRRPERVVVIPDQPGALLVRVVVLRLVGRHGAARPQHIVVDEAGAMVALRVPPGVRAAVAGPRHQAAMEVNIMPDFSFSPSRSSITAMP